MNNCSTFKNISYFTRRYFPEICFNSERYLNWKWIFKESNKELFRIMPALDFETPGGKNWGFIEDPEPYSTYQRA